MPASDHLAVNVALYGRRRAWGFVEQAAAPGALTATRLQVGASVCHQDQGSLTLQLDVPRGLGRAPLRGRIVLHRGCGGAPRPFRLDAAGNHRWWPLAPCARVEAHFPDLGVHFVGRGYHDANVGDEPLARGFADWQWMRTVQRVRTAVDYVASTAGGACRRLHLAFGADGSLSRRPVAAGRALGRSGWRVARAAAAPWRVVRTLEDTPFYVRSLLRASRQPAGPQQRLAPHPQAAKPGGEDAVTAMHEGLDLRRHQRRWVRFLLPFRLLRLP